MGRCASCPPSCTGVCLHRPNDFVDALREVDGFDRERLRPFGATPRSGDLPHYIPVLQRVLPGAAIATSWAAVPLGELIRGRRHLKLRFSDGAELRRTFGLPAECRVVVIGPGPDRIIERYWRYRREQVLEAWGQLDLAAFIAPNFSCILDRPRPEHLFNRKRSLMCAVEASRQGVPTIPYLLGIMDADWRFWRDYLHDHPHISMVAKEFQTGLANPTRGRQALEQVERLQDALGRPLHMIAVGGASFLPELQRFPSWSVLDSTPCMKAIKRRRGLPGQKRVTWKSARDESPAALLNENLSAYEAWFHSRCEARRAP